MEIDDHPQALKMLLFVRSAWSLEDGTVDLPDLDPRPNTGTSSRPTSFDKAHWVSRWNHEWHRTWAWYQSQETQNRSTKQAKVHNPPPLHADSSVDGPPFWIAEYGTDGVDMSAFREWDQKTLPEFPPPTDDIETNSALVSAWNRGLTQIVVLPYKGDYSDFTNTGQLAISDFTRKSSLRFRTALDSTSQ